jgi:hypothetical protein
MEERSVSPVVAMTRASVAVLGLMALFRWGVGPLAGQAEPPDRGVVADEGDPGPFPRGTVGVFIGRISSRQIWSPPFGTDALNGLTAGLWIEAQTPISFLSVRAEAGYAQKGTLVWDEGRDPDRNAPARVRSHYLTVPIHGKVAVRVGPLRAFLFGGPSLDLLLSSRCSEEFCQFIRDEKGAVVNAAVGTGLDFDFPGGFRVGLEGRITEGLGDAYRGEMDSARNRSTSVLARIGRMRGYW